MHFAKSFPEEQIVYTLCRKLSWSHLRLVMYMDAEIKALEKKLEKYEKIKQGMMQNLLTGRIRLV